MPAGIFEGRRIVWGTLRPLFLSSISSSMRCNSLQNRSNTILGPSSPNIQLGVEGR